MSFHTEISAFGSTLRMMSYIFRKHSACRCAMSVPFDRQSAQVLPLRTSSSEMFQTRGPSSSLIVRADSSSTS